MMERHAYLIISDLHIWYKSLRSRKDYRAEIEFVWNKLLEIANKYRSLEYSVKFLFLGDIFHRGYDDVMTALKDSARFYDLEVEFCEPGSEISTLYSVVGNHETSFYKDNVFFSLVKDIKSETMKNSTALKGKVWTPRGDRDVIHVVDRLDDGNVHFYFNHFGTDVVKPTTDGVNIGLFHQDLMDENVKKIADSRVGYRLYGSAEDIEKTHKLSGYKYSFLGHMHQLFGLFGLADGSNVYYLGSLCRSSVDEVNDQFLTRDIPVVLVENGQFKCIEKNEFNLMSWSECVLQEEVDLNKEAYELTKDKKSVKEYTFNGDRPVDEVKASLQDNIKALQLVDELLERPVDAYGELLLGEINSYGRKRY